MFFFEKKLNVSRIENSTDLRWYYADISYTYKKWSEHFSSITPQGKWRKVHEQARMRA